MPNCGYSVDGVLLLPNICNFEGILMHEEWIREENAWVDCSQFGGRMSASGLQNANLEFVGQSIWGAAPFVD